MGDCTHSVQLGDLGDDEAYTEIESQVDSAAHRFFAGNHDHYHCLPVHSLGDFGEVTLGGVAFFFVRGAASMDKAKLLETGKRIGRQLWLAEEELRDDQMSAARQEYSAAKPQIMISHDAPTRIARFVCQETSRGEAEFVSSRTSDFLETLLETHRPKLWLFGHYHHDWEYAEFGTHFRCVGELSFVDIDPNGQLVGCASRQ